MFVLSRKVIALAMNREINLKEIDFNESIERVESYILGLVNNDLKRMCESIYQYTSFVLHRVKKEEYWRDFAIKFRDNFTSDTTVMEMALNVLEDEEKINLKRRFEQIEDLQLPEEYKKRFKMLPSAPEEWVQRGPASSLFKTNTRVEGSQYSECFQSAKAIRNFKDKTKTQYGTYDVMQRLCFLPFSKPVMDKCVKGLILTLTPTQRHDCLLLACERGNKALVESLLDVSFIENGQPVGIEYSSDREISPLLMAVTHGHKELVRSMLTRKVCLLDALNMGETYVSEAINYNQDTSIAHLLWSKIRGSGFKAFSDPPLVKLFIKRLAKNALHNGIPVNKGDLAMLNELITLFPGEFLESGTSSGRDTFLFELLNTKAYYDVKVVYQHRDGRSVAYRLVDFVMRKLLISPSIRIDPSLGTSRQTDPNVCVNWARSPDQGWVTLPERLIVDGKTELFQSLWANFRDKCEEFTPGVTNRLKEFAQQLANQGSRSRLLATYWGAFSFEFQKSLQESPGPDTNLQMREIDRAFHNLVVWGEARNLEATDNFFNNYPKCKSDLLSERVKGLSQIPSEGPGIALQKLCFFPLDQMGMDACVKELLSPCQVTMNTCLSLATERGNVKMINRLLDYGFTEKPNISAYLQSAVQTGQVKLCMDWCIEELLSNCEEKDKPQMRVRLRAEASNITVPQIKSLLEAGKVKQQVRASLRLAAERGNVKMIRSLLDAGVAVNDRSDLVSPLSTAILCKQEDAVAFLLSRGANVNLDTVDIGSSERFTPLTLALKRLGNPYIITKIWSQSTQGKTTEGHRSIELLLDRLRSVAPGSRVDIQWLKLLMKMIFLSPTSLAVKNTDPTIVKTALDKGDTSLFEKLLSCDHPQIQGVIKLVLNNLDWGFTASPRTVTDNNPLLFYHVLNEMRDNNTQEAWNLREAVKGFFERKEDASKEEGGPGLGVDVDIIGVSTHPARGANDEFISRVLDDMEFNSIKELPKKINLEDYLCAQKSVTALMCVLNKSALMTAANLENLRTALIRSGWKQGVAEYNKCVRAKSITGKVIKTAEISAAVTEGDNWESIKERPEKLMLADYLCAQRSVNKLRVALSHGPLLTTVNLENLRAALIGSGWAEGVAEYNKHVIAQKIRGRVISKDEINAATEAHWESWINCVVEMGLSYA